MPKVFVGMSGGVDSSVTALLLTQQGYDVTGIYMKNWSRDLPGLKCPWAEDLADAKRVAVKLGIPFEVWDFEADYRAKVVDYMLSEFKRGLTPNPDIMCNQEIKFKLFYERARERGADYIATGHYARIIKSNIPENTTSKSQTQTTNPTTPSQLARAKDENKDQTYFLYRISQDAINHTLFPLSDLLKPDVKKLAAEHRLHNAYKKESMGVCFVGAVGMRDFLQSYIETKPGDIREIESDKILGVHEGVTFYTIGQRHGLYLSGVAGETNTGLPYYVVAKDLAQNIVYVSRDLNYPALWTGQLELRDIVWRTPIRNNTINPTNSGIITNSDITLDLNNTHNSSTKPSHPVSILVRLRHRAPLIPATFDGKSIKFDQKIKRPASGQSAVFYDDKVCLGGGIIV